VSTTITQRLALAYARYEARASEGHLAAAEREFLNEALRLARFAAAATEVSAEAAPGLGDSMHQLASLAELGKPAAGSNEGQRGGAQ
jgi:hypothetical protein